MSSTRAGQYQDSSQLVIREEIEELKVEDGLDTDEQHQVSSSPRPVVSEPIKELKFEDRLNPSEINYLLKELKSHILGLMEQQHTSYKSAVVEEFVLQLQTTNKGFGRPIRGFILENDYQYTSETGSVATERKRFAVFDATKDVEQETINPVLFDVTQIIQPPVVSSPTVLEAEVKLSSASENWDKDNEGDGDDFTKDPDIHVDDQTNAEEISLSGQIKVEDFCLIEKEKGTIFVLPLVLCAQFMTLSLDMMGLDPTNLLERVGVSPDILSRSHITLVTFNPKAKEVIAHDSQGGVPILGNPLPDFIYEDQLKKKLAKDLSYKVIPHGIQKFGTHVCGFIVHNWVFSLLKHGDTSYFDSINASPENIVSKSHYLKNWREITSKINPGPLHDEELHVQVECPSDSEEYKLPPPDKDKKAEMPSELPSQSMAVSPLLAVGIKEGEKQLPSSTMFSPTSPRAIAIIAASAAPVVQRIEVESLIKSIVL